MSSIAASIIASDALVSVPAALASAIAIACICNFSSNDGGVGDNGSGTETIATFSTDDEDVDLGGLFGGVFGAGNPLVKTLPVFVTAKFFTYGAFDTVGACLNGIGATGGILEISTPSSSVDGGTGVASGSGATISGISAPVRTGPYWLG